VAGTSIFSRTFEEIDGGRIPDYGDGDWSGDGSDGYNVGLRHEG
jgi:hypothetical protein